MKPIIYATTTMIGIVCFYRAFPVDDVNRNTPSTTVQQSAVAPFSEPVAESQDAAYGITPQPVQVTRVLWHTDTTQAFELAKQEAKPVLVVFSMDLNYCYPCKVLEQETLTNERMVIPLSRFVCLRMKSPEAAKWNVRRFPRVGIFTPERKLIRHWVPNRSVDDFIFNLEAASN